MARTSYTPDKRGLAEIGRSSVLGEACLDAARRGAAWANQQHPAGDYQARGATILSGYDLESRAGAIIEETGRSGAPQRILARTIAVIEA